MSTCDYVPMTLDERTLATARAIQHSFDQSAYRSLRRVKCDYRDGVLTLCGEVPTFFLKQMAQSLAASVIGVGAIANQIQVSTYGSGKLFPRD